MQPISLINPDVLYDAISYAVGSVTDIRAIQVDDQRFNVTVNLDIALRQLRSHDRDCLTWIDQVCINQNDALEKKQQVLRMREIYSNAHIVKVSLGACEHAVEAVECIQAMSDLREEMSFRRDD